MPDNPDGSDASGLDESGPVLGGDELDFTDDERVAELGDGGDRYVVSTGSAPPVPPPTEGGSGSSPGDADAAEASADSTGDPADSASDDLGQFQFGNVEYSSDTAGDHQPPPSGERANPERVAIARDTIASDLRDQLESYGFDAALLIEGKTSRHASTSDDIESMTRGLLQWLALSVDDSTPQDEVLGILLLASGVSIRYPTRALAEYVRDQGLSADDSIEDLFDTIQEDGGFRIPRRSSSAASRDEEGSE